MYQGEMPALLWAELGFNPVTLWAWNNLPLRRDPRARPIAAEGVWIVEAFHGLELGRFSSKQDAEDAISGLLVFGRAVELAEPLTGAPLKLNKPTD